jgi:hypothetical protein
MFISGVSTSIFKMLNVCSDADPNDVSRGADLYLTADLSLSCSSARYSLGVIYAKCMIVVYPVGIPVFYLAVLWWNKDKILQYHIDVKKNVSTEELREKNMAILPMQYLYGCYKPQYWYFEVIETLRRLMLTGFLTVIYPSSTKQLVVGIFINLYFLTLYTFLRPYNEEELQFCSFLGQCQLIMIFFISILLREKVDINPAFINTMLVLCIFTGIFYELFSNPISKYFSKKTDNLHQADHISSEGSDDFDMSQRDITIHFKEDDIML